MNMKAFAAVACLWVPVAASAADDLGNASKMDSLSQKLEKILATQGISVGGQFRGEFGSSDLSGNGYNKARREVEDIGYTSVDFDLRAKPNTSTQARAVFRMHLDDASFFGSPYTPLETRWLSIDGTANDGLFYYHLGNMLQKWSPLTMWSPEPGYVYTPRIFAQAQKTAMDERFLGNNNRNLQGATFGIRGRIPEAKIDTLDASLLVARLLTAAPYGSPVSEFTSSYNVSKKDGVDGWPAALANYDRILLGGKAKVTTLGAITIGANFLVDKDLMSTYGASDSTSDEMRTKITLVRRDSMSGGVAVATQRQDSVSQLPATRVQDSLLTNGRVISGTFDVDGAKLLGSNNLILGLNAEFAQSSWDYFQHADIHDVYETTYDTLSTPTQRSITKTEIGVPNPSYKTQSGTALNGMLRVGWKTEKWAAAVRGGYLMNDSLFRSDLAQTPVFNKRFGRVYNSEQDVWSSAKGYSSVLHYNLFDAMYHNVHHWIAEEQNEYSKNAYDKLAYSNYSAGWAYNELGGWTTTLNLASKALDASTKTFATFKTSADSVRALVVKTAGDSATIRRGGKYTDSAVADQMAKTVTASKMAVYKVALDGFQEDRDMQLVLPGGEASANRVGPKVGFDATYLNGGVDLTGDVYMLQETKGSVYDSAAQTAAVKAKFQSIQAGARVRVDRFFPGWNYLLNPKKLTLPMEFSGSFAQSTAKGGAWLDYSSTQISASAYVGIVPRLSLLAGFQSVTGDDKTTLNVDRNYTNIAGGLEFKIQEGAYFLAQYNLLKTEYPDYSALNFDQSIWTTKISVSF